MTTNTKTTTTKKNKPIATKRQPTSAADRLSKMTFEKSDWVVLPLIVLVVTCFWITVMTSSTLLDALAPPYYLALASPAVSPLLIALFGILYIYKVLWKQPVRTLAKAIMYTSLVVLAIFLLFAATTVGGKGATCTGLYGVRTDCSQVNAFELYVLFANPFTLTFLSALAIAGGAALLVKFKK